MSRQWILSYLWLLAAACSHGQQVTFSGIVTRYDGAVAQPQAFVDGLPRDAAFSYREIRAEEAPAVFSNRIPEVLPLSYNSVGFAANSTSALGNLVELSGSQRVADSVEVIMVTWATAAEYSALSSIDASGYRHPVTATIYQLQASAGGASSLLLLDEATVQVQIPWRPATMPDGTAYPHNGYAFKALIPLAASITVPDTCVIAIRFNTQKSGVTPLGVPGPYNKLNLAISSSLPSLGRDPNADAVFWIHQGKWYYPAINWGGFGSPMLRFSARATALSAPLLDSTFEPVNAGTYHARGKISPENLTADTVLSISKAPVIFKTAGLTKSIADPDPFITLTNSSPGLAAEITYNGGIAVPAIPGKYPFSITATDRNHSGTLTGEFYLTGMSYAQWLRQEFRDGGPAGQAASLAYATGSDSQLTQQPLRLEMAMGCITASFRQRREMIGVRIALEFSPDLFRWNSVQTREEAIDDFWEIRSTNGSESNGFFRLKVEVE
jgi:hypothetical protein